MEKALISVVVPVYNAQKTLSRCIESIQKQTYPHLQLLLVNDGSKDDSLSICLEYASRDSRIKVIDIDNGGVSNARNTGILNSDGDYVTFIDSDDYVYDDYLETLYTNNTDAHLLMCGYTHITSQERTDVLYSKNKIEDLDVSKFFDVYMAGMMGSPCNKIYDLHFIKQHQLLFNRSFTLGEDLLFNLAYIQMKGYRQLRIVNKPILYYDHASEGTLSTTFNIGKVLMVTNLFKEMLSFMQDYCKSNQEVVFMKERFYYDLLFYCKKIYESGKVDNKELFCFIKDLVRQNDVSSLKEICKISKNYKLKIKLLITYYLNFKWYYRLFVR